MKNKARKLPNYGPLAGNFSLLRRHPADLTWEEGNRYRDQLHHQCIRHAWALSSFQDQSVDTILDLVTGRAAMAYCEAMGHGVNEHFLQLDIDKNRYLNREVICFGLFLDEHIDETLAEAPAKHFLWKYYRFRRLQKQLQDYQSLFASDRMSAETILFASNATRRPHHLEGCARLKAYVLGADLILQWIEEELNATSSG